LPLSHPNTALTLNNLSELCWVKGADAEAEALIRRALRILENTPDAGPCYGNFALLKIDLGQLPEANRLATLSDEAYLKKFSEILSFGSEEQRLSFEKSTLDLPGTWLVILSACDTGSGVNSEGPIL
jgi:hypothetical protein